MPVVHPLTGETFPAGTPLPLTAFARRVLSELPEPNVPGVTSNNYQKGVPNRSDYDKWNVRLDHKFNERLSGFVRFGQQKNDAFEAPNIDGPSGSNQNGFINVDSTQVVAGGTWILGRASVLDARLGYSHTDAGKKPPTIGGPSMLELYGIPGLPDDPELTGGLTPQTITGYSQLGRQATNPQFQNPSIFNPRVSLTHVLGRHSLKVGFEYAAINTEVQDTNPLYGLDSYTSQFSRPAGAAANNQYNLADFYFGARTQYELASLIVAKMRQRGTYAYVQDDIRVTLGADRQPRPALRVRDAVLRSREPPVELRSRHRHADHGARRVDRRPGPGRPRPQQLRAALRARLAAAEGHRRPRRLRHRLHPLQPPGERRAARHQHPDRHARHGDAGADPRRRRPRHPVRRRSVRRLLPDDAAGLCAEPAQQRHALRAAGHAVRATSRAGTCRCSRR